MASEFVRKITNGSINEPLSSLENGDMVITKDKALINVNGKYLDLSKSYDDSGVKADIKKLQDDVKNIKPYDDTVIKADIKNIQDSIKNINTKLSSIDDRVKKLEQPETGN